MREQKDMPLLWSDMECEPKESFSKKLLLSRLHRREKERKIVNRVLQEAFRAIASSIVFFLFAGTMILLTYGQRGYLAFGGEILLSIFVTFCFWVWLGSEFSDIRKGIEN